LSIQKYSVNQYPINTILSWIKSGEIAIPEIQRPFVWNGTKVRDLVDSLYQGYPIGYLIGWKNPDVKLKDGSKSSGKRILIDGQQRVTALMAAFLGREIVNEDYKTTRIIISFHPQDRKFEVANPAIQKDPSWIHDISNIVDPAAELFDIARNFSAKNPKLTISDTFKVLESLRAILNNQIGLIELDSNLDIETVTEIFIRINSQGVVLSQADFAMSKIAANETYKGNVLRKAIDYFCHLAVAPEFFEQIRKFDVEFGKTEFFQTMSWLKDENDDLYDPAYTDMLRVSFTSEFKRGRLEDLVALLSGRNFEARSFEESIAEESFAKLQRGVLRFMNATNFKRFLMIVRSAGFIDSSMIRSQNSLNFSYILYLLLTGEKKDPTEVESIVRRWLVLSILTGRYSGSAESMIDLDVRRFAEYGAERYVEETISAELSDSFWNAGLPQQMNTSVASSPLFKVFIAAQIKGNEPGFLSKDITVRDLISHRGDVHHLFPKNYLKKFDVPRGQYNQIANFVIMQSEINIAIRDRAPSVYFSELLFHSSQGKAAYGAISNLEHMQENFRLHCIPEGMENKTYEHFQEFLRQRRLLMAKKIQTYFGKL